MAVIGVLAEAHVGDDDQFGRRLFEGANRLRNHAAGTEVVASAPVLFGGNAEEYHGRDAQFENGFGFGGQLVHRELELPRHGGDGPALPLAVAHEDRVDEVCRGQRRLSDHAPQGGGDARAPRAPDAVLGRRPAVGDGRNRL